MRMIALLAGAATLVAGNAAADFEIEKPRIASQEVSLELTNSIRVGDVSSGQERSSHSVGVNYGAFEYWTTGFAVELANRQGDTFDVGAIEWSNNFQVLGSAEGDEPSAFAMSIYSAFEFSLDGSKDVEFSVGPAFEYVSGATTLNGNTFFYVPTGSPREKVGLRYALGTMYSLNSAFALGVEAHGDFENIFDGSSEIGDQDHFAGPAMNYEFELDNSQVEAHLGAFYGLTDATPTMGIAANLELGF